MGAALYTAARYDDAIAVYRDLVALQPDNFIGFHMLGLVAQKQGHPDEALSFFQRAVSVAASPPPQTLSSMGFIYHERGDYRQAVEAFRTALQARSGSAATHRNLGDSLLKLGRDAAARASYRRAADLAEQSRVVNPADALNLASLAVYLEKAGDDGPARQRLAEALQRAPADPEVCYRGALVHAVAGRSAEALAMLERAVAAGYSRSEPVRADEFERLRADPRFQALIAK
jgi:tetratricopeptide (TPR) repeat protein